MRYKQLKSLSVKCDYTQTFQLPGSDRATYGRTKKWRCLQKFKNLSTPQGFWFGPPEENSCQNHCNSQEVKKFITPCVIVNENSFNILPDEVQKSNNWIDSYTVFIRIWMCVLRHTWRSESWRLSVIQPARSAPLVGAVYTWNKIRVRH